MGRLSYSRWRRVVMQVVLCIILAGSIGLANLVTQSRRAGGNVRLSGIRWFGRVGVKTPAGWSLESVNQGPVLLIAQEPEQLVDGIDTGGRRLVVRRVQLDAPVTAGEYLQSSGLLRATRGLQIEGFHLDPTLIIAGTAGIIKPVVRPVGLSLFSPPSYITEWIGCAVRPNGLAITLQLDCPNADHPDIDQQYLRDIASAIEVRDAVTSSDGKSATIFR